MQLNLSVIAKEMLLGKEGTQSYWRPCGRVVRALGFKSAGSGSQPQALPLTGFVLGYPEFNSLGALLGFLNTMFIHSFVRSFIRSFIHLIIH